MRHGEEDKASSGPHLSKVGFARSQEIPQLVKRLIGGLPIAALYAQGDRKEGSSLKSQETLQPLATLTQLTINKNFNKWESREMVQDLKRRRDELKGKAVVIAWGSDELSDIVRLLGFTGSSKNFNWVKKSNDRVFVLQYDQMGRLIRFSNLAQQLLGEVATDDDFTTSY